MALGGAQVPQTKGKDMDLSEANRKVNERPLSFVENAGQWNSNAKFLLRSSEIDYWVTSKGFVLDYKAAKPTDKLAGHAVAVEFAGGNQAKVAGEFRKDVVRDYITNAGSVTRANGFNEVRSEGVYKGIDLRSYVDGRAARYDIEVSPNTDPSVIELKFTGAKSLSITPKGDLAIGTSLGTKEMVGLKAYQMVNGKQKTVASKFVKLSSNSIGFKLGGYDSSKKLIIDPLIYGSYYGGDNGPDTVQAVSSDIDGGVYLTGKTRASQFPAIFGPYGFNLQGGYDAYLTKLQGDAYSHDYAALFGGNRDDEGTRIGVDPFGNVWIAGITGSLNFPTNTRNNIQLIELTSASAPTGGTFTMSYQGTTFGPIPFNASPADIQALLEPFFGVGNVVVTLKAGAGTLADGATYKVELNRAFNGTLSINSTGMRPRYREVESIQNFSQILRAVNDTVPTAGFYTLSYNGVDTVPLAFNANGQNVFNALNAIPELNGNIELRSAALPADIGQVPYLIYINLPDPISQITVNNANLTGGVFEIVSPRTWFTFWDRATTIPTGGSFLLQFGADAGAFNFNSTAAQMQAGLSAFPGIGDGNILVTSLNAAALPNGIMRKTFIGDRATDSVALTINDNGLQPRPTYEVRRPSDMFVMRFAKAGTLLDPLPSQALIFGGDGEDQLAGFSIKPSESPVAGDPVEFILAGNNEFDIPNITTAWNNNTSYFARYQYNGTAFAIQSATSGYFSDSRSTIIGGAVLDAEGSMYIGGGVINNGNIDTAINPVFVTTPNAFEGGRLLRNSDLFARKYNSSGTMLYSVLVGGNNAEIIGGFGTDSTGAAFNVGSAIAVDLQGNAYIVGRTNSFNYPRTRGVFGETFTNSLVMVATKINSDGSAISYSTNLRTSNGARDAANLLPAGIAVDLAGNVHITGNLHPYAWFPENNGADPADPNEPVENVIGSVPVSADALDPDIEIPEPGQLPTSEGFYMVLNNTATNLLYSSYLGGILDDIVYGPYVDAFGDSWLCGYTDSYRRYVIFSSTGTPTIHELSSSLPASLITPLAFKANGDAAGGFSVNGVLYGALNPSYPFVDPLAFPPPDGQAPQPLPTVTANYQRDGYVLRQRVAFPSADSVVLTPNTIPGGLGANSIATFTLSAPAPAGGADVTVTLNNSAVASFANGADQTTLQFNIPAGQTTATFPVFSKPVNQNATVDVRATYLGSFKIARLNVIPWLQQLGLTPTDVVGGNTVSGRVTLAAAAPASGVTVDLLTDSPSLINFGTGVTTVTIPAGQQTGNFTINTLGVAQTRFPTVTASLLGVGRTQSITVRPITLSSLTFAPSRIAGGATTAGTVVFSGRTGEAFNLKVTLNAGTGGYRFRADAASPQVAELILPIPANTTSATFLLDTKYEAVNTQRVATATILSSTGTAVGSPTSGTIFVDAVNLTGFSINPTSILGGGTAQATVTIGAPAPQGGVTINLESAKPAIAPVPASVTIEPGQTSVVFDIPTTVVFGNSEAVGFKARRGSLVRSASLNVLAGDFGLTLDPTTVTGGTQNSVGTIDIGSPAPAGGLVVFTRSSNTAAAVVPNSITIPAGEQIGTFPITTRAVAAETSVTISAILGKITVTRTLTVNTTRLLGFTISPNQLRPLRNALATVELATPAPAGGVVVDIQLNTSLFAVYPTTLKVTVPAGQTTATFNLQAKPLSINTRTTVRATAGGSTIGVIVDIRR